MRRVHLTDLHFAARALMCIRPYDREASISTIMERAHATDKYRKRMGRSHPRWGAGRLADICMLMPMSKRPDGCDPIYLRCMAIAVAAVHIKISDK